MSKPFTIPRRGSDVGNQIAAMRRGETKTDKFDSWSIKELKETIGEQMERAQALVDKGGKLSPEDEAEFNRLTADDGEMMQMSRALRKKEDQALIERNEATQRLLNQYTPAEGNPKFGEFKMESYNAPAKMSFFGRDDRGIKAAADFGHTLKALVGVRQSLDYCEAHAIGPFATATEGTDTAGGYLIPSPVANSIIQYVVATGVAGRTADVRTLTSNSLDVPKLTSGPTVTYPGESSAITASDQVWGNVRLSCTKKAVLSKVSNELLNDNVVALGEQIAQRIGYELRRQLDAEYILGDGTATYGGETGLVNSIGTAGVNDQGTGNTWGAIVIGDFTDTMALLPSEYDHERASWICSPQFFYSVMLSLEAAAGGNSMLSLATGTNDRMPMFLGKPVHLTDSMPSATAVDTISAFYGDYESAAILGIRQDVTIGTSADRYFDEDVTAFRGLMRSDINVHEEGDASDAGAYVALSTGS